MLWSSCLNTVIGKSLAWLVTLVLSGVLYVALEGGAKRRMMRLKRRRSNMADGSVISQGRFLHLGQVVVDFSFDD